MSSRNYYRGRFVFMFEMPTELSDAQTEVVETMIQEKIQGFMKTVKSGELFFTVADVERT